MTANTNRFSSHTTASGGSEGKNGEPKKDLWSSMLDSVASGKRLPEKNILVLGGTVESQRDFLESLSNNDGRRSLDRPNAKIPPVANHFALGYTYYDVLDADQEDILARISLYILSSPSSTFSSLIQPLLTPQSIPNTLIVVLLDWSQPWNWMRQLRRWILLLRTVLLSLSDDCKETMEEVMISWRDRGRGGGSTNLDGTGAATAGESDVVLPPGPGEWEDALGLPLCVVCQNSQKMELLEKTQGWKEEEFDVVLQYMRTVLLKHGASLIYTTPSSPSQLQSLIHSSLGIHSLLKRQPVKDNVIDRDKIVVPPNWDSWGKIRILREGFDVEGVSAGWSLDLAMPFPFAASNQSEDGQPQQPDVNGSEDVYGRDQAPGTAVSLYEVAIANCDDSFEAQRDAMLSARLDIKTADMQEYLAQQLKSLEAYKAKAEEEASREESRGKPPKRADEDDTARGEGRVSEHIGPVQFNMGGIQVDADDMLQRIKDRQTFGSPEPNSPDAEVTGEETPQMDTENLQAFFSGLMNRKGAAHNITNSSR